MRLFVDTSAFYALTDQSDAEHARVLAVYEPRAAAGDLVTSDYVLVESCLLVRARLGPAAARRFWPGMRLGPAEIVGTTAEDLDRAWSIDSKFADQQFGLVDSTSFALIERLGIEQALSLDTHFRVVRLGRSRRALAVIP